MRPLQVWKRQQAAAAEAKKAEELRKQLEEERKQNEFKMIAESAGHIQCVGCESSAWAHGMG